MQSRRTVLKYAAIASIGIKANLALADPRNYKHTHEGNPSTGSNSHLPGYGETSFDRETLENYFQMPSCVHIIHHAKFLMHEDFDSTDLGIETYPLWVREDAPVENVTLGQVRAFLEIEEPLFHSHSGRAYLVRHGSPLNQEAFFNAVGRIQIDREVAARHSIYYHNYLDMRKHCLKDKNAVLLGYRRHSFKGLRPLLIDGLHPQRDWEAYPLSTETYRYVRRGSFSGKNLAKMFIARLAKERDMDVWNWSQIAST